MNLEDLISPIDKKKINTNNISYFSEIPDLYFDDKNSITSTQSEFYNDVKFPNYDDIDNFGTLLDKSSKSIFAKN